MKKTVLLLLLLATNIMTFAQDDEFLTSYDSKPSSDVDGWIAFYGIVLLIFAVLQIILFFKVWGNDK